jgi:hypothetical protein
MAVVERGLGLLAPADELALRRHLESCPDCAAEERIERLLRDELSSLRQEIPHPVDVRTRVMPRIHTLVGVAREEVPARHLGWAGALAATCSVALLAGLWLLLPELPALLRVTGGLISSLGSAALVLSASLLTLIALPFKLIGIAIDTLGSLGPVASRLEPVGLVAVGLSYAAMAATITLVVGRDLKRPLPAFRREES